MSTVEAQTKLVSPSESHTKIALGRVAHAVSNLVFTDANLRRIKAARAYLELVGRTDDAVRRMQREYVTLLRDSGARNVFAAQERKVFSQNGEDGLLLYIFSRVGAPTKTFIEFGIQDGTECNAANLTIHFGWAGLFIESDASMAASAARFYRRRSIGEDQVQIAPALLTVENVNAVFEANGRTGEIDLLSIDIDGNDYWIWQAITVVVPRVVVIEYNASFGVERSVTVPYEPVCRRYDKHPSGWYHGASLRALTRLAETKGYVLVGCDSSGANAFFVRRDAAEGRIRSIAVEEAFYPSVPRVRAMAHADQCELLRGLEYVDV